MEKFFVEPYPTGLSAPDHLQVMPVYMRILIQHRSYGPFLVNVEGEERSRLLLMSQDEFLLDEGPDETQWRATEGRNSTLVVHDWLRGREP